MKISMIVRLTMFLLFLTGSLSTLSAIAGSTTTVPVKFQGFALGADYKSINASSKLTCTRDTLVVDRKMTQRSAIANALLKEEAQLQAKRHALAKAYLARTKVCEVDKHPSRQSKVTLKFFDNRLEKIHIWFRVDDISVTRNFGGQVDRWSGKIADLVSDLNSKYGPSITTPFEYCTDRCAHTPLATKYEWNPTQANVILTFMPYGHQGQTLVFKSASFKLERSARELELAELDAKRRDILRRLEEIRKKDARANALDRL